MDGVSESSVYDLANRLTSRAGGAYTNDLNGNTLTGGGRTNTWDGQNRLTQCVYGGVTTTHTYGSDGLRRRTVQGANTTDFLLDGDKVVRTKLNGVNDKTYLTGLRGPEYERDSVGTVVWNLFDGLGSVVGTVDATGTLVSTRKYDGYGAVRGSTGPSGTKHKYVGGLGHPSEDETGLIYMRARYYDPVTGRFASEDPSGSGCNWFAYASNNPIGAFDPAGEITQKQIDWLCSLCQSLGAGCIVTGIVMSTVGVIAWYTPHEGSPRWKLSVPATIELCVGAALFGIGCVLLRVSWLLTGMTPEEWDSGEGDLVMSYLASAGDAFKHSMDTVGPILY
jgi:RHS repeat-associated protein